MFVAGIDIGYSNLKVAWGESGVKKPNIAVLPAGAAPKEYITTSFMGGGLSGFEVNVEGVDYVAGVQQSSLEGWYRVLSKDYPFTDDYKALFYAGLLVTERSQIDVLVTGLPIEQATDTEYRDRLQQHLKGRHEVSPGHFVDVAEVQVIPQPIGAFYSFLMECDDLDLVMDSRVMIVDPGFYSVDYCTIDRGNFDRTSASSSQEAMSVLLEETSNIIHREKGRPFDLANLEDSVRGKGTVAVFGEKVDLEQYLRQAASSVAENVIRQLKQDLRRSKVQGADYVLLTGGGAGLYSASASKIMENSKVVTAQNPISANANGYFEYGRA